MNDKIASLAKSLEEDIVKFLRDIVAIPSRSGNEEAVIKRMKLEMEKHMLQFIAVHIILNLEISQQQLLMLII